MRPTRLAALALSIALAGCTNTRFDATRATPAYPADLHTPNAVDIQVFRDSTWLEIVNATPHDYYDADLWINQRFTHPLESLQAGQTIRISLREFFDERGETLNAGGFFRTEEATPIRLVQIQVDDTTPLVGLVTIRAEEATE